MGYPVASKGKHCFLQLYGQRYMCAHVSTCALAPPVKATLFCGSWWESLETLPLRTFCGQE